MSEGTTTTGSRPDAVQFGNGFARSRGAKPSEAKIPRSAQVGVVARAEALLLVDRAAGERAHCRNQGGFVFASRSGGDTLLFPHGHDLAGRPRYEWADQGDGVMFGTLVPEARG
ncbi:hypothetical protein [Paludisphaera soli]|uniref:hypothetical protein n=1 Tax=Paludisphaera soli TaxID=2712865 RepID=UPI0013EBB0F2|nr:hypothetical protein [Paludisphaera soli]